MSIETREFRRDLVSGFDLPFAWIPHFIKGLSSIYAPKSYPTLKGSDSDRLFSDVMRVGGDFKSVFEKQHDNQATTR
ncbi:MAG: hypothetical protein WBI40_00975 [Methylococcaceae bacterium]